MKSRKILSVLIMGGVLVGNTLILEAADQIKQIDCGSKNFKRQECSVNGAVKVLQLLEQKSTTPCVEGDTFGFSNDYVWVDKGCEAKFEVSFASRSSWWRWLVPSPGRHQHRMSCKSKSFTPTTCRVGGRILSLKLRKQKSTSPCTFGTTYGYRGESVWVSDGCEADFEVNFEPGDSSSAPPVFGGSGNRKKDVSCESKNYKYRTCGVDGLIEYLQLSKQKSSASCVEGDTFGFSNDYIWVDKGCHGEFEVRYRQY
jgi:hypothetical protein